MQSQALRSDKMTELQVIVPSKYAVSCYHVYKDRLLNTLI